MTRTATIAACLFLFTACAAPTQEEEVGKSSEELTAQTVEAVATVGQVAASLSALTEQEPAAAMGGEEPAPPVGVDEPAEPPCASIEWNILDPLRVTIRFADCTTQSGELVNGAATAWLNYDGVNGQVGVALDALTIGDKSIDGFLVLAGDGPNATLVDTDIHYVDPNTQTDIRVVLDGRISNAGGIIQLDGFGSFESQGEAWTATASGVRWDDQDSCVPTAGDLDLTVPELPAIHVTFTTAGMVVTVAGFPVPPSALACE